MELRRYGALFGLVAMLSSCGGGGTSPPVVTGSTGSTAGGTTSGVTPATGTCSLRTRQDWAAAQLREWYLFPETLPASLDPAPYADVGSYVDALTATARAQRRDRYFTYLTSIKDENAFYASGASAGFGIRLTTDSAQRRVFIAESFEGAPALAAGIDRGAEIVAIGTGPSDLRSVNAIIAAEGSAGVTTALGPSTAGTTRLLRISDATGVRDVTVAKADYAITPVSARYGAKILTDGSRRVGYVNLRTFITTAEPALRDAFAQFRAQGVTDLIVDLRYNGGGLIATAELMSDLLGRDRAVTDVQGYTTFRPEKSSSFTTRLFRTQAQSVAPTRIAFIGTGGTASASEYVINAFTPYLHARSALVGTNTYGKPVGQIALDLAACDDRLRVIAFAVQNSARSAAYFDGLAPVMEATCQATDELAFPLGDARESSTARALDFLAGRTCMPIGGATAGITGQAVVGRELLMPYAPAVAQREVPGLF